MASFGVSLWMTPIKKGVKGKPIKVATNSWVRQAAQGFGSFSSREDQILVKDISGVNFIIEAAEGLHMACFFNASTGVKFGSNAAALSRDDFTISELGFTQDPDFGEVLAPVAITGGYRIVMRRTFLNNTGGSLTINEAGVKAFISSGVSSNLSLLVRDLVSPAVVVVAGDAIIGEYRFDFLV